MSSSFLALSGQDDPKALVPDGWVSKQLGATCDIFGGGRLGLTKEKDYQSTGVLAFSAAGPDGFVDVAEIKDKEGVILSAIGANCGRCFFASGDWTTLANVQAIIPKEEIYAKYLFYYVNRDRYWDRSGSAQPFIKPSSINSSWVVYPAKKTEQSKIAEVLSTLDRAIEQTEALIAKQQCIKTGLMQDLLTKGIDEHGNIRSEATHALKDSPLGRIPVEWSYGTFGELWAEGAQNGLYKPQSSYSDEGTPIVRIDGFRNGDLIERQTFRRVELNSMEQRSFSLKLGDLVVNRVNSIEWLGKAALVGRLPETTVFESNMMRIRVDQVQLVPAFCILILSSPRAYGHFLTCAKTAIAQASINQEDVRSLPIACPPPNEQVEIVRRVDVLHELIVGFSSAANKLVNLKTGLMHDLLTGNRRVTPLLEQAATQ